MDSSPNILIISGLDPSGGAGFLADVGWSRKEGYRSVGVVTALTVQSTKGVQEFVPVESAVLEDQLVCLLSDIAVDAIKIGMVGSLENARAIQKGLELTDAPLVLDPLFLSTNQSDLFTGNAPKEFLQAISVLAADAILTPNKAEWLLLEALAAQSGEASLLEKSRGVVVTSWERDEGKLTNRILTNNGFTDFTEVDAFGGEVHGTGCAFSTLLACQLGKGVEPKQAVKTTMEILARHSPMVVGQGLPSLV